MIRNLGKNDFNEYYRIRLKSLQDYPLAYSSMPQFFTNASRKMHDDLLDDSAGESRFFIKGNFENEKLLGIIGMKPETRECVNHKASLWGFYVEPEHQGRKIGTKLLQAFLADANRDKKLRYVRLMASVTCESALALFYSVGFEKYGLERDSICEGQNYYDQIYMQLSCS